MQQGKEMRPTYRPKHERRINENSRRKPQRNYTNPYRGKHAPTVIFDEMPSKKFDMPPIDKEPSEGKMFLKVFAFVLAGFALLWAITWVYGHFRWGW